MAAMPADADPGTCFPMRHPGAEPVDPPGHLMARHARIIDARKHAFLDEDIAVANAAGFDLDAHLAGAGLRHLALDQFEIGARRAYLNRLHFRHRTPTPLHSS